MSDDDPFMQALADQNLTEERKADIKRHMEMFGPEELRPDLRSAISERAGGMVAFHHPLHVTGFYAPAFNRQINKTIAAKERAIEDAMARRAWTTVLSIHERPYRMDAFKKLQDQMTDAEFWKEVSWLWTDSENIWQNLKDWRRVWRSKRPGRETVMDDDERAKLQSLPDVIEVFRGTYLWPWMDRGLSWTLDRDRAIWFAYRFKPEHAEPSLISGKVRKKNVLAYFDGRSEQEIVMLPERLITDSSHVEELPPKRQRLVSDSG